MKHFKPKSVFNSNPSLDFKVLVSISVTLILSKNKRKIYAEDALIFTNK